MLFVQRVRLHMATLYGYECLLLVVVLVAYIIFKISLQSSPSIKVTCNMADIISPVINIPYALPNLP